MFVEGFASCSSVWASVARIIGVAHDLIQASKLGSNSFLNYFFRVRAYVLFRCSLYCNKAYKARVFINIMWCLAVYCWDYIPMISWTLSSM